MHRGGFVFREQERFGLRQSPVFVGEVVRYQEIVHYVAPPPEDLQQKPAPAADVTRFEPPPAAPAPPPPAAPVPPPPAAPVQPPVITESPPKAEPVVKQHDPQPKPVIQPQRPAAVPTIFERPDAPRRSWMTTLMLSLGLIGFVLLAWIYLTAWMTKDQRIQFRNDIYAQDEQLLERRPRCVCSRPNFPTI